MGWAGSMSRWRNIHPPAAVDEITFAEVPQGLGGGPTDDLTLKGVIRFTALNRGSCVVLVAVQAMVVFS